MSEDFKPPARRKISDAARKKFLFLSETDDKPARETMIDRSQGEGRLATARWGLPATDEDLAYAEGKLWLGFDPVSGEAIGHDDDRHALMIAGSRAGKGTSFIVNNLVAWPGSLVCVDPKGENATVTARRRGQGSAFCHGLGQKVCVLDPMRATAGLDDLKGGYNPLEEIDPEDDHALDDAIRIADAIVVTAKADDPFFDESARDLLKGLILHVLSDALYEGRRNLVTVRRLVTHGDEDNVAAYREIFLEENPEASGDEIKAAMPSTFAMLFEAMKANDAFHGVVSGVGVSYGDLIDTSEKTYQSIVQTLRRNTEFIDSPGMRACLETSSLALSELKTDPGGVSLYLSLPQRYMRTHFRWLRMMVALSLSQMEKTPGQPACGHRVLTVLDEFAGLKKMEEIENAAAQIAGFGVKLMPILQNIGQLKAVYDKNWQVFFSNASTKIFFGIEDHETQKFVSEYIGNTEVVRSTQTQGQSIGQTEQRGQSSSIADGTTQSRTRGTSIGESWSETLGTSASSTWSTTHGTNSSQTSSRTSGWNKSSGASWQEGFFGPKNVSLNRSSGVSGSYTVGSAHGTSHSTTQGSSSTRSHSTTQGGSRTTSESATLGTSRTATDGTSESVSRALTYNSGSSENIHKTALITPDEIGVRFGRIDNRSHEDFPGLALVMISGRRPYAIRRANYFEAPAFAGLFDPHPDHPTPASLAEQGLLLLPNDLAPDA
ncbi:MAG: type IV secretory system conjugative DNA transfer family protein [Pseudomonadota bacterium]